jgi:hypothetical protein
LASAPPEEHEAPLVLHPIGDALAPVARIADALVVVSLDELPPRAPAGATHPSLRKLGGRAVLYVRSRRRARRIAMGRQTAVLVLGVGALGAMVTLAMSGGGVGAMDAARAALSTHSTSGDAASLLHFSAAANFAPAGPSALNRVAIDLDGDGVSQKTLPPPTAAPAWPGAWAPPGRQHRFVAYPVAADSPFLVCTRSYESDRAGGYRAVDPDGVHFGAYQYLRSTWDTEARAVGRWDLVGVNPRDARPVDQDWMAMYLYHWQGASPWRGRCAGL